MKATVRVRANSESERPDRNRLESAARELATEGFDVLRVGRFGVSVSGDRERFLQSLGVDLQSTVAEAHPSRAALRELVDLVQLDSEPEYFHS